MNALLLTVGMTFVGVNGLSPEILVKQGNSSIWTSHEIGRHGEEISTFLIFSKPVHAGDVTTGDFVYGWMSKSTRTTQKYVGYGKYYLFKVEGKMRLATTTEQVAEWTTVQPVWVTKKVRQQTLILGVIQRTPTKGITIELLGAYLQRPNQTDQIGNHIVMAGYWWVGERHTFQESLTVPSWSRSR